MEKTIYFFTTILISMIFISSCSKDNSDNSSANLSDEIESYGINIEGQEEVFFNTQKEVLSYLKSLDKEKFLEAQEKFDFLNNELKVIQELDLVNKDEDDPAVIEYLERFSDNQIEKIGPLNFCHHDTNQSGKTVWTPAANPRIKKKNRNKYSSITAISSQVLCSRTWWRGSHKFFWGTPDGLGSMNNDSESYY